MLVRHVMTPDPAIIRPDEDLYIAQQRMNQAGCRRLPVVDETGQVCGIITDRDLRLATHSPLIMRERWQDDMLLQHTAVGACMTPDPLCIGPDEPVTAALEIMLAHKFSGLPVVEGGRLVGILTVTDLMRALQQLLQAREPER